MKRIYTFILVIVITTTILIADVSATSQSATITLEATTFTNPVSGEETTFYTPNNMPYVYVQNLNNAAAWGLDYVIIWTNNTLDTNRYAGGIHPQTNQEFYVYGFEMEELTDEEKYENYLELLFSPDTNKQITIIYKVDEILTYGIHMKFLLYTQEFAGSGGPYIHSNSGNELQSLEQAHALWETMYRPKQEETGTGTQITDKAPAIWQTMKNEIDDVLQNNQFYTGLSTIIDEEIIPLINMDYSDSGAVWESLGLFRLGDPSKINISRKDGSTSISVNNPNYIDMGLNGQEVMNLKWFFGGSGSTEFYGVGNWQSEGNGSYEVQGIKRTTDTIISGFLWIGFVVYVWKHIPELIEGIPFDTTEQKNKKNYEKTIEEE